MEGRRSFSSPPGGGLLSLHGYGELEGPGGPLAWLREAAHYAKVGEPAARSGCAHQRTGTWPSLVGHLTGGQGVAGSNPAVPTGQRVLIFLSTVSGSQPGSQRFPGLGYVASPPRPLTESAIPVGGKLC